jgi:type IV secretion system protein VirB9
MGFTIRTLALSVSLFSATTACTLHQEYLPALPAQRAFWDNSPLVAVTPPPPELRPLVQASIPPGFVPSQSEWDLWRPQAKTQRACAGKGKARRCTQVAAGTVEEANSQATVRPTRRTTEGGQSAQVRYSYREGKIYEIQTAPHSPTYLLLPPGERLAAPPAVNPDAWATGLVQMGRDQARQEAVVLRPVQAPQESTTALLFQSGLMLFCRLIATEKIAMVSVAWDLPAPPASTMQAPEMPIAQRPPKIDLGRLFTAYRIEPPGKITPPWMPVSIFDDGTRTYIKFAEALTYTRAPGVFGVTPQGGTALVQSHMYVLPNQPERGAWLLVQGLWPALDLKDNTGLAVRIVRQAPQAVPVQEVKYAH